MANVDRSRAEILRRRVYETVSGDVINKGDMLVFESGKARPASFHTDNNATPATRKTTVQDEVADVFIGVSIHHKPVGSVEPVVVGVDGYFEMDLPAAAGSALEVGTPMQIEITDTVPAGAGVATGAPQMVSSGGAAGDTIGKLAKRVNIGDVTATVHMIGLHARPPALAAD